jgi:predicted ABC-type ATPase
MYESIHSGSCAPCALPFIRSLQFLSLCLMLETIADYVKHGESFSFETTLSGLTYAQMIPVWRSSGYAVKLIFLSLPDVEIAIERVATRVKQGGHNVPEEVIRRRFAHGIANFERYKVLVDSWQLYDNSGAPPVLLDES